MDMKTAKGRVPFGGEEEEWTYIKDILGVKSIMGCGQDKACLVTG